MPDTYDNVGTTPSEQPPGLEVQLKINHGDPNLAISSRIEIPESVKPAEQRPPVLSPDLAARLQPAPTPALRENAAPFNMPDSRIPATEYVSITPTPIPRPIPRSLRPPVERPVFTQPLVMNGQAIGPIIRKRPAIDRTQKVVQPLSIPAAVTMVAQDQPPQELASATPLASISPEQPAQQAPPAPIVPQPPNMPSSPAAEVAAPESLVPGSTIASQEIAPELADVDPSAPAVTISGAVLGASPNYDKPIMAYSQNTRAVWHVRRSGKTLSIVLACGLVLVLIGVYFYWKSIGSPTNVQDIPLLHLH